MVGALAAALALYRYRSEFVIHRSNREAVVMVPAPADNASALSDEFRFSYFDQPRALPDLRFTDAEDHALSIANFLGRPIVLNLWATWCVPCRKEMPALDRLQAALGKSELLVLPLSLDRQGAPAVTQFYERLSLKSLGIYIDQSGKASSELNAAGVPTTLLIDRDGHEVGRKLGPAEWDSPEMIALIGEHLGLQASEKAGR